MPTEPFRTIPGDQCHHRPLLAFLFSLQEAFSLPCGETDVADVAFDEAGWLSKLYATTKTASEELLTPFRGKTAGVSSIPIDPSNDACGA